MRTRPSTPGIEEINEWPDTPYCNGQRASLAGEPRVSPSRYTGGASDGGAGEWYYGYDDAERGDFYG